MASLGELLCNHTDELVQRWYDWWRQEGPALPEMTEAAIKDHLPVQLRVIGDVPLPRHSCRPSRWSPVAPPPR